MFSSAAKSRAHSRAVRRQIATRSQRTEAFRTPTPYPAMQQRYPVAHKILFGTGQVFGSAHELAYHESKMRFCVRQTQQSMFENGMDFGSHHRYKGLLKSPLNTTHHAHGRDGTGPLHTHLLRYDKQEHTPFASSVTEVKDEKKTLHVYAKSMVDAQAGRLLSVRAVPVDIWLEPDPELLAELVFRHVYEKSKVVESAELPADANEDAIDSEVRRLGEKLARRVNAGTALDAGSPIISTTTEAPPMAEKLEEWGKPDQYIEIDADQVHVLTTTQAVDLILHHCTNPEVYQPAKCNWRDIPRFFSSPDCPSAVAFEKLLESKGIPPNGPWTVRERTAFFLLVANEHMLLGSTPPGSVRVVDKADE